MSSFFRSSQPATSASSNNVVGVPLVSNEMCVVSTPEAHLVYTNHAFLAADSPANAAYFNKEPGAPHAYIQVNESFVYVATPHPKVQVGQVALSSVQRETLRVSLGESARVTRWSAPPNGSADLVHLRCEVELVGNKRVTIQAANLAPMLVKHFTGQVLTRGQIFAADFVGTPIKVTVLGAEAGVPVDEQEKKRRRAQQMDDGSDADEDEGQITREVDRGVMHPKTTLELLPVPSKFLTWKAEESSKRSGGILNPKFRFADMGIGGLDAEFGMIFRRSFASRLFPPEITRKLGIRHVKGMLLYGPPGTGKTLIARQIGKLLAAREPKVVNGPEILNKFVGASEENIRNLFKDAEEDQAANGDAAELHIIIFDEIDAICKARGRGGDSTGVHDTVVNQLLSKIDGVNALNNILVIGMTNRKDMIDPALLRPGRLEVHIEIGLPDEKGRKQIFNIHLKQMKESGMLGEDVSVDWLASQTKNFSGAEIEAIVKSASSFALYASIDIKNVKAIDTSGRNIVVRRAHFEQALEEVKPSFGVDEDELRTYLRHELLDYGDTFNQLRKTLNTLVNQVRTSKATPLLSVLLEGPNGSGKTSLAAQLAFDSGFPFVKVISPEQFVGYSELKKCNDITKIFEDAYKSPLSLIILDSIERLLEYVAVGPRFSQAVLQTLLVLVNRIPPHANRKLLIIGTSSRAALLESLEITQAFNVVQPIPALTRPKQVALILQQLKYPAAGGEAGIQSLAETCYLPIPIKQLLMVAEMAKQGAEEEGGVSVERFQECLSACGFDAGTAMQSLKNELAFYTGSGGGTGVGGMPASSSNTAAAGQNSKRRVQLDDSDEDMA